MKGGCPNERSRRNWGSLDLDRRHLGSLYFACHRFSRLYLLIIWPYPSNVLIVTFLYWPCSVCRAIPLESDVYWMYYVLVLPGEGEQIAEEQRRIFAALLSVARASSPIHSKGVI